MFLTKGFVKKFYIINAQMGFLVELKGDTKG
jgi:hypothetical protein